MKKLGLFLIMIFLSSTLFAKNEGATVYITRPFQYVGSGVKAYVEINGIFVGNLASATTMKLLVPAGPMNMNLYVGNGKYEKVKEKGNAININIGVDLNAEYFFEYQEALQKYEVITKEKTIEKLKKRSEGILASEILFMDQQLAANYQDLQNVAENAQAKKSKTFAVQAQPQQTTQQNSSNGTRSYSIEELQALGVIGGGNNNQQPAQQVASTQNTQPQQTAPQRTLSDVDKNIPVTDHKAENTFVLIIANEDYQFVDKVDFAKNDGQTFKEYCVKTLGVPEKQVWLYENASYGVIKSGISKMTKAMNLFDNPNAIIYYCGHGIPDEKTGDAYLIPTDGNGKDMATCYSLNLLYKTFAETKAANVTYFMDACFTGASKEGSMLVAARGVAREPKKEVLGGKTVVFSATSSDETAMAYKEKQHGLFTYYLLKKLQETKGDVSYEELSQYIKSNVQKEAFLTNEKPQTPVVATSPAVGSTWKTMTLK